MPTYRSDRKPSFRARMMGVAVRITMKGHVLPPPPYSRREMNFAPLACQRCGRRWILERVNRGLDRVEECRP